jgi:hypothetical protein
MGLLSGHGDGFVDATGLLRDITLLPSTGLLAEI